MGNCFTKRKQEKNLNNNFHVNDIYNNDTILPMEIDLRQWRMHKRNEQSIEASFVIALYDYHSDNYGELAFSKGDKMNLLEKPNSDWYYVVHETNRNQGFVPRNYVEIYYGQPTLLPGWYDISRQEAIQKLILPGLKNGTYILRNSSCTGDFALSVRHLNKGNDIVEICHYKITSSADESKFYISERTAFANLEHLLNYYKMNPGLCCHLTEACAQKYVPPVQFRDVEVNRQCIELKRLLGRGEFGEVHQGLWNKVFEVAVKVRLPDTQVNDFINEAKLMHKLNHSRIVRLLGVCTEPPQAPVYIITELMRKGSLKAFLKSVEGRLLKQADLIAVLCQVAEGMCYLEEKKMVHRDLRSANILVDEDYSVKVADFGLSRLINTQTHQNSDSIPIKLPVKWTAPECAGPNMNFSIKSDVWSFGVLMYEVMTYGETPYPGILQNEVLNMVRAGYRMKNPDNIKHPCPDDIYKTMSSCWEMEPTNRPTFEYLFGYLHNWASYAEQQYVD